MAIGYRRSLGAAVEGGRRKGNVSLIQVTTCPQGLLLVNDLPAY